MSKPQKFTSRLASIEKVSSKVYLKRFDLVTPREIAFLPGQTVMLQVAPGINRSMSIASPPSEKTSILVAHDVSPMGPYSRWTINANVGDEMHFIGPLGVFVLDAASPRKKVFIATGTGISPFRSMVLESLGSVSGAEVGMPDAGPVTPFPPTRTRIPRSASIGDSPKEEGCDRVGPFRRATRTATPRALPDMTLYWGLRREEDIFWNEEFEALAANHPNFKFVLTLSQPRESWLGTRGHVTDHVLRLEKDWKNSDFYLCGNKMMVDQMREELLTKNVPKGQIKSELFY